MNFDVCVPFKLTRHGKKKLIHEQSLKDLIALLEEQHPGLSTACGCYVFAVRAGRGCTPYYVGQSCRSTLPKEALNPYNREKYNKALNETNGSPILFLIPLLTPGNRYRKLKKSEGRLLTVNFLERWLIAKALEKNPDLINSKETRFLRNIHVRGLFNAKPGEATTASRSCVKALE